MKKGTAYLLGTGPNSFRVGEPAKIIGVEIITFDLKGGGDATPRPCYVIQFDDGLIDYTPIEAAQYQIISFKEIISGEYKDFIMN